MADIGVTVRTAAPRSVAGLGAFGDPAPLVTELRSKFDIDLPSKLRCVHAGGIAWCCLAPGRFLVSGSQDADLPARLSQSLDGLAAVTDQSDMWATFIVSGVGVREVLARIVPIDLDVRMFQEHDVALTRAGHLDVRLSQVAHETFEIAVTRSQAADLRYALDHSSN